MKTKIKEPSTATELRDQLLGAFDELQKDASPETIAKAKAICKIAGAKLREAKRQLIDAKSKGKAADVPFFNTNTKNPKPTMNHSEHLISRAIAAFTRGGGKDQPSRDSSTITGDVITLANVNGPLAKYKVVTRKGRECVRAILAS